MAAGQGYGSGCNMPLPSVLFSAIRTAILRNEVGLAKAKEISCHTKDKGKNRRIGIDKFGSLQLNGIFLYHDDFGVLYPMPKDVLKADKNGCKTTVLGKVEGKILPLATIPPSKERVAGFWTEQQLAAYLQKKTCDMTPLEQKVIWQPEWRVGVEIDPLNFANKEGQLYAGEYMRLAEKASFVTKATLHESGILEKVESITFGGERRLCSMVENKNIFSKWTAPTIDSEAEYILKWVLLTPAIFVNGSTPGWVVDKQVKLQPKINGQKKTINAELLAHSVGSPLLISGWDIIENRTKPSINGVDSGAVYYFKCASKEDANNLAKALHGRCRSDMRSEKGFGFGLTSIENFTLIN